MFESSLWDDYFDISGSSGDLIPAYANSDNMNETPSSSSTISPANKHSELVLLSTLISIACVSVAWFQNKQVRKLRSQVYAKNMENGTENKSHNEVKSNQVNDVIDEEKKVELNLKKEVKPLEHKEVTESLSLSTVKPSPNDNSNNDTHPPSTEGMIIQPIGTVSSLYRLCVGTPRQGLLAPHSKGIIKLDTRRFAPIDALDQLHLYSHLWIVFIFHLNTNSRIVNATMNNKKDKSQKKNGKGEKGKVGVGGHRLFPSKVSPPALGGKKVGMFATRTPHRPNPIGFSLCQLDYVDTKSGYIYISGLDLVDGTPVVDIKPYVPHYDSIGYAATPSMTSSVNKSLSNSDNNMTPLTLPSWVSSGLEKRRPVHFTLKAEQQLFYFVSNELLEFYGNSRWQNQVHGKHKEQDENSPYVEIRSCIIEVLSVDVRSSWQTKKARNGASQADRALKIQQTSNATSDSISEAQKSLCTQQLDNLLIYFTVKDTTTNDTDSPSHGSGCNDIVVVKHIQYVNFKDGNEYDYHNEVWNHHEDAMYEEVWEILLGSVEIDHLKKLEEKEIHEKRILNEDKMDLTKILKNLSDEENIELSNNCNEDENDEDMRQNIKIKNESLTKNAAQTSSDDQQKEVDNTASPQQKISSNQESPTDTSIPKEPKETNKNKKYFTTSTPVKSPPVVVKSKKNVSLVPTAVQDSGDYNKLQSYWKEVAKTNTPTGLMPESSKQVLFKE